MKREIRKEPVLAQEPGWKSARRSLGKLVGLCLLTVLGVEGHGSESGPNAADRSTLPLGPVGLTGCYRLDHSGASRDSMVESFTLGFGAVVAGGAEARQWLVLRVAKPKGPTFQCWLLCDHYPPAVLGTYL